jgi:hypothetical protein
MQPTIRYDTAKWKALVDYDPEIASATATVARFGPRWVDKLAGSYLALNDKAYLPTILQKVISDAQTDKPIEEGVYEGYSFKKFIDGRVETTMDGLPTTFNSQSGFTRFVRIKGPNRVKV